MSVPLEKIQQKFPMPFVEWSLIVIFLLLLCLTILFASSRTAESKQPVSTIDQIVAQGQWALAAGNNLSSYNSWLSQVNSLTQPEYNTLETREGTQQTLKKLRTITSVGNQPTEERNITQHRATTLTLISQLAAFTSKTFPQSSSLTPAVPQTITTAQPTPPERPKLTPPTPVKPTLPKR